MENKQDGIIAFDTLFTNNHICMLKLLLPMLPPSNQKSIAIYIKYMELQYTLQYFARHPQGFYIPTAPNDNIPPDINTLIETLLPYCTSREKESFTQMRNMFNTFRNMQEMMEMMNMIKEMFPEGFAPSGSNDCDTPDEMPVANFSNLSPDILTGLSSMLGSKEAGKLLGDMDITQILNMLQMLSGGA